jgi:hypothetical protein
MRNSTTRSRRAVVSLFLASTVLAACAVGSSGDDEPDWTRYSAPTDSDDDAAAPGHPSSSGSHGSSSGASSSSGSSGSSGHSSSSGGHDASVDSGGSQVDAGHSDAGSTPADSGVHSSDSGSPSDSGVIGVDSGVIVDSGSTLDAGVIVVDSGAPADPCDISKTPQYNYCLAHNADWASLCCPAGQHGTGVCLATQQRCAR